MLGTRTERRAGKASKESCFVIKNDVISFVYTQGCLAITKTFSSCWTYFLVLFLDLAYFQRVSNEEPCWIFSVSNSWKHTFLVFPNFGPSLKNDLYWREQMHKSMQQSKEKKALINLKMTTHKTWHMAQKSRRDSTATPLRTMKRTVTYPTGENAASDRVTTSGPDLSFLTQILIWQQELVPWYCPADKAQLYTGGLCIFGNRYEDIMIFHFF